MAIKNLTPHTLNIISADGTSRSIEPTGTVARCSQVPTPAGDHDGVSLTHVRYGDVTDLPAPVDGVLYVVSALVRSARPNRTDVASPGDLVRNDSGQVIGCRNLVVN
jgi:hypothetical protein